MLNYANYIISDLSLSITSLSYLPSTVHCFPTTHYGSLTLLLYLFYGTFHYLELPSSFICFYIVWIFSQYDFITSFCDRCCQRNWGYNCEPMSIPLRRETLKYIDNNNSLSVYINVRWQNVLKKNNTRLRIRERRSLCHVMSDVQDTVPWLGAIYSKTKRK